MIQGAAQNVTNRLSLPRVYCSLDKEDIRRFLALLQERANAAADMEVRDFQQLSQTDEEYETNKQLIRAGFDLRVTFTGENGQELYGPVDEVLGSPNFPEMLKYVYINSENYLKAVYNYTPRNSFEIFFDFSRPAIFDFSIGPSEPTPNESNVRVNGNDATWANGVFHEVQQFLNEHKSSVPWLHTHSIYDVLLWFFGYPVVFWTCYKLSPILPDTGDAGSFLKAALYIYIAFVILVFLRALFHYARWVFPSAEYQSKKNRSLGHKAFLGAITVGLMGAVIYDVLKSWLL